MRQKRILASYCLSILMVIVPAFEVFPSEPVGKCYVMLQPEDTIWDYYVCEGCGSTASAKPDVHNRQACPNCPKPHTTEPYIETPLVERGGKLYALLPVFSVPGTEENEQALSGKKFNCPWCKSSIFKVDEQCPGCGARFDLDSSSTGLHNVRTEHSRSGPPASGPSILDSLNKSGVADNRASMQGPDAGVSHDGYLEKATAQVKAGERVSASGGHSSRHRLKIWGLAAGSLLLATVGGASYWGSLGSVEPGVVIGVTGIQVLIEYADSRETRKTISISPESGEGAVGWRVGEKVQIYLTNWSGPKGAERYNGDAYQVDPPPKK
jgi:hypothetical protein